jgi:hypothetical protein
METEDIRGEFRKKRGKTGRCTATCPSGRQPEHPREPWRIDVEGNGSLLQETVPVPSLSRSRQFYPPAGDLAEGRRLEAERTPGPGIVPFPAPLDRHGEPGKHEGLFQGPAQETIGLEKPPRKDAVIAGGETV